MFITRSFLKKHGVETAIIGFIPTAEVFFLSGIRGTKNSSNNLKLDGPQFAPCVQHILAVVVHVILSIITVLNSVRKKLLMVCTTGCLTAYGHMATYSVGQ